MENSSTLFYNTLGQFCRYIFLFLSFDFFFQKRKYIYLYLILDVNGKAITISTWLITISNWNPVLSSEDWSLYRKWKAQLMERLVGKLWNFNSTSPACRSNIVLSSKERYCMDGAMENNRREPPLPDLIDNDTSLLISGMNNCTVAREQCVWRVESWRIVFRETRNENLISRRFLFVDRFELFAFCFRKYE